MRRVRVANRRDGGWWWRAPVLAVLWAIIAAPIVVALVGASTLRRWAKDLPEVPDLAEWRANTVVSLGCVTGKRCTRTPLIVSSPGAYTECSTSCIRWM